MGESVPANKQRSIAIIAGVGPRYGGGHITRMRELIHYLSGIPQAVRLFPLTEETISSEFAMSMGESISIWVLDARDVDPTALLSVASVLALDNRWYGRAQNDNPHLVFYDTIPHPLVPLEIVMEAALIRKDFLGLHSMVRTGALLYGGSFSDDNAPDAFLRDLLPAEDTILKVGGEAPSTQGIEYVRQLESAEFSQKILQHQFFLAHFGMGILEAWKSGAVPVIIDCHKEPFHSLSVYLHRKANIPILSCHRGGWEVEPEWIFRHPARWRASCMPGDHGFEKLVKLVLNMT